MTCFAVKKENRTFRYLLLIVLLQFTAFSLYGLGVGGPFLFDDFNNLIGIAVNGGVQQYDDLLRYAFGAGGDEYFRSVARLSFVMDDQYWPAFPHAFKMTNIAIHLLNSLLIVLLLLRILPYWLGRDIAYRVALLCAALWVLHPLHVSTTLYVVQRMTQLMLFFLLSSLLFYCSFRNAKTMIGALFALICAAVASMLSVMSKENGAIALVLYVLLEWVCFKGIESRFKYVSRGLSALLGLLFVCLFVQIAFKDSDGFDGRFYSLWERLQVQGEVLLSYIQYLLVPNIDAMGLYHDDVEWRIQREGVGFVGLYWLVHVAVLGLVWFKLRHDKIIVFGVLWFYLGHLIESTVLPLELMYEHRNYLPSIGLLLIVAYGVEMLRLRLLALSMPAVAVMLVVAPLFIVSVKLVHRVAIWSDYRMLVHKWAAERPDSLRAQYEQVVLLENDAFYSKAVEEAWRVEQKFDDLTVPMYRIRLECKLNNNIESKQKLSVNRLYAVNYSSGITMALKGLIESSHRMCINRSLDGGDLDDLIAGVADMPLLQSKSRNYAQYLDTIDSYYLENRDYIKAIKAREELWKVQPTISTALKLIELFYLGANYDDARRYLEWAKAKNNQLWFHDSMNAWNIAVWEERLDWVKR